MMTAERIYIGGIEPPRLTVSDVLDRLKSSLENQVEIKDLVHEGSFYCHLNAVSHEEDRTALEAISKLYNNVKWKGCKLKVEPARPHFLERLKQERRDREDQQREARNWSSYTFQNHESSSLPRHLKIRRGYGEESWRVDTRPCAVTEWESFNKVKRRLEKQRRKDSGQSRKAHWNRAVHLRFEDGKSLESERYGSSLVVDENEETEQSETESDSSTESESEAAKVQTTSSESVKAHSTYVWSDDDDTSDDESVESLEGDSQAKEINQGKDAARWKEIAMDEFAAAYNDDDNSEDEIEHGGSSIDAGGTVPLDSDDLNKDVETNLNVLAQLFPEMKDAKPVSVKGPDDADEQKPSVRTSGWGATGQMLRYDPTKQSAEKYVLSAKAEKDHESKEDTGSGSSSENDTSSERSTQSSHEPDTNRQDESAKANIYEQGKLEEVFREAREIEAAPVVAEQKDPQSEGGFSFSFNLGPPPEQDKKADGSGSFTFSFSLPGPEKKDMAAAPGSEKGDVEDESMEATLEQSRPLKRRRGFSFPKEDIEKYVEEFYSLNEGERIMKDLEGFRNDEKVKEEWNKERKALTLDWKRKRKYALSKKQKRNR